MTGWKRWLAIALSLSATSCWAEGEAGAGRAGTLLLTIEQPDLSELHDVTYRIDGLVARHGSISSSSKRGPHLTVEQLPVDDDYTIAVEGRRGNGVCTSRARFAVRGGLSTRLSLHMKCRVHPEGARGRLLVTVDVQVEPRCPLVTGIMALPLETGVGGVLELEAFGQQLEGAALRWSAERGRFLSEFTADTDYSCTEPGVFPLSFRASKPGCPATGTFVEVICSDPSLEVEQ